MEFSGVWLDMNEVGHFCDGECVGILKFVKVGNQGEKGEWRRRDEGGGRREEGGGGRREEGGGRRRENGGSL